MNTSLLVLIGFGIYVIFYFVYGKSLEKRVIHADEKNLTPAHRLRDNIDYMPANKFVLFGHHFASIAGAGPILGPAIAMIWGWLPGILWVWFGNIFIGATHDYLSLMASVRHDGKSIQWISGKLMGKKTGHVFSWFVFLALILVIAAFSSVIADLFAKNPQVATASILFIMEAGVVGVMLYKLRLGFMLSTVTGILFLILSIIFSSYIPVYLSAKAWLLFLILYSIIASVLPVWILLQPRDYLNAWILFTGILIGGIGLVFSFKSLDFPFFTKFSATAIANKPSPFWPTVPLIIACGALSGFHSVVASGTTSKQLDKETSGLFVGYGAMFSEGFLATLVIASIAGFGFLVIGEIKNVGTQYLSAIKSVGGPGGIFSKSFAQAVHKGIGLPLRAMEVFASLWISAFVLTTLDTTVRLSRFLLAEIAEPLRKRAKIIFQMLSNRIVASMVPAGVGLWLAWGGAWTIIWPAFAGTNQMLASIALLTVSIWATKELACETGYKLAIVFPSLLLWITVTSALIWFLIVPTPTYAKEAFLKALLIGSIVGIMLGLNFYLLYAFFKAFKRTS